jgi:hypothetical protein
MTEITTKQVGSHTISITENWKFSVSGPEFEDDKKRGRETLFASFEDARNEIEKRVTDSAKIRAQGVTLSCPIITSDGKRLTITRIDRRTGEVPDISDSECYPDVPWVFDALHRRKMLYDEIETITSSLRAVRVSTGRIGVEEYPVKVAALDSAVKKATAKAFEMQKLKEAQDNEPKEQTA